MRLLTGLAVVVAAALYGAEALITLPRLSAMAGGQAMFDLRLGGYDPAQARSLLAALGEAGRAFYAGPQQTLDRLLPAALALAVGLVLWRIAPGRVAVAGSLLAVAAAGADWLENARIGALLAAGPEGITPAMVAAASLATRAKALSWGLALGLLAIVLAHAAILRYRRG